MPNGPIQPPFMGYDETAILTATPENKRAWAEYARAWMRQDELTMPRIADRVAAMLAVLAVKTTA